MKQVESKYKCLTFWSWNDELDEKGLCDQMEWMNSQGVGGFFMHARGGLKTEYLGDKWFSCIKSCGEKAQELDMQAYAYDENGWPSGFAGGKLLEDIENHDMYLTFSKGKYDEKSLVSYSLSGDELKRVNGGDDVLNVYANYSGSTADILNGEVVDKFLALTHEEYKKRDTFSLKGFFTDEPQYFRWATAFTRILPDEFKKKYGEDILDGLGLLFVEKKGYKLFRYRYWKLMQELMLENFAKKIYLWCDENGYKLTGHYTEEESLVGQLMTSGGVMAFYEYEHIPGIDWLTRYLCNELTAKQLGSVASELDKRQVLVETFAGAGWDITPKELKKVAESSYVYGINLMCQHLLPYSEHGQRKRDCPAHFSAVNPWVEKDFKNFNDYFSVLGKTLSESREIVNVGYLSPLTSAYFFFKRYEESTFYGLKELNLSYYNNSHLLSKKQIPHHILDETILRKYGKVVDGKLVVGKCSYEYIVVPKIYNIEKSTDKLLQEFMSLGGKILFVDNTPTYLEGVEHDFSYLKSNTTLNEILSSQSIKATESEDVRYTHRISDDGKEFIYLINLGEETEYEIRIDGYKSFLRYDIISDSYIDTPCKLKLKDGESMILYPQNKDVKTVEDKELLTLSSPFTVENKPDNYLTLDLARYSFDGENFGKPIHHLGILDELLRRRYKGDLYLKYEFSVKEKPENLTVLVENNNLISVSLNGKEIKPIGRSKVEKQLLYFSGDNVKVGNNEVVVKMNYFQSESVYYALFGEGVTESLKNCLVYDSNIEAIFIKGDFGVYGDFTSGEFEDGVLGQNFYIAKQKTEISELIRDGFPFFRGDIKLKKKVFVEDTSKLLYFNKRFHYAEIFVNGKKAGNMLFNDTLDISEFLVKGENEIEIILTVGNRNLLGPFHRPNQSEYPFVGPFTFERTGTWKDGVSSDYRDDYLFIKSLV